MFPLPESNIEVKTTCPYCGVGCGVIAKRNNENNVLIKGDPDHPSNFGGLCSKGSALGETVVLDGRLLEPHINGEPSDWDSALNIVAKTFNDTIAEHGPDSVAFYVSGQILTEDYYVANKLMKGFIGSANIDTNSRLCMASSVAGQRRAFGSDTVPGTYEDFELADLIVLVGSNLAWCHPVLYQRIAAAKALRPDMKVVLIDPRKTMSADIADLHLAIKPDGDVALFTGLLHHLAHQDAFDFDYINNHTIGFKETINAASGSSDFETLSNLTGLSSEEISEFYNLFLAREKTVTVFSQGVNQSRSGTDKVTAIINCHLATGRIGKEGMGPFSVTGQPNAMGGREVGGLANMLAAHMDIENSGHRDIVQRFWKAPNIAQKPGLKAVDMFKAVGDGRIKALWIMATNPVVSLPEADDVAEGLKNCPFVVVSDVLKNTDTTAYAHVLLPSADWGEKDGTVTNSERRISRQRRFLSQAGSAKPDWWQLAEVGKRMGFPQAFEYTSTSEIFAEHAALSGFENGPEECMSERDFNISALGAINEDDFNNLSPFQWPYIEGTALGKTRFFADGQFYTPDRKARLIPVVSRAAQQTTPSRPLTLNTGRIRDHWHTLTRTGRSTRLSQHIAEPFVEINPEDALHFGVRDADIVQVENEKGYILVRALVTPRVAKGQVFVPMHWNDQFSSKARVNTLVPAVVDPFSGQPASKNAAVFITKFHAKSYGFAVLKYKPQELTQVYTAIAKVDGGWRVEFADLQSESDNHRLAKNLFGKQKGSQWLSYGDDKSSDYRIAAFKDNHLIGVLFLSNTPVMVSRNWAIKQIKVQHSDALQRHMIVAGRAGGDRPDIGAIVCSCFGIGSNQIASTILEKSCLSVDEIGKELKAGTNCGSCRSEIKQILNDHVSIAAQ
ncbi:MAG: molybdopterin-dependent oxidoreductase [Halopseudomonas aestusnigri]